MAATGGAPTKQATPRFAVRRPHLVDRLESSARNPLTLVTAPPGYGKTHLLTQWATERVGPAILWLSLESADDNAVRLAHRLVATFQTLDPELGRASLEHLDETGSVLG